MSRRKVIVESSNHTTSSRDSEESYESRSTAATSIYDSPRPSTKDSSSEATKFQTVCHDEDLSPSTSVYPRSSVDTYSSQASTTDLEDLDVEDCLDVPEIPPLPIYRHEIEETNVRASTPEDFANLFPSMNRLTIRHDDFTADGNMNLRVDTVVTGRRRRTIQLFHLRMYDLARRDFSFRRYCRDSGREVCNSKRKYIEPAAAVRPAFQRSMSSAMKTLTGRPPMRRNSTASSMFPCKRPDTSHSTADADEEFPDAVSDGSSLDGKEKPRPVPSNTIKLEFSNYARVDIQRRGNRGNKKYEFEWWGHKYSWKRVVDKHTGVVSFHLLRNGNQHAPVAHIVPETRSPNQIATDEEAGGWVPPCHMWISDKDIIDAATDVAE